MLNFFRNFAEWLLGVINSLFKQNIEMDKFLNILTIVVVAIILILILLYIDIKKKYNTLKKNIKKNNIQVVRQYKHGKYKDVIKTKTELRNPKKNKKLGKPEEFYHPSKNVTNIVED